MPLLIRAVITIGIIFFIVYLYKKSMKANVIIQKAKKDKKKQKDNSGINDFYHKNNARDIEDIDDYEDLN